MRKRFAETAVGATQAGDISVENGPRGDENCRTRPLLTGMPVAFFRLMDISWLERAITMRCVIMMAVLLIVASAAAASQAKMPGETQRQANQRERLEAGMKDGELTGREVRQLEARQRYGVAGKRIANGSGFVTNADRLKIRSGLHHAGRAPARQRNETERRHVK
jgi:hypothetical protein